MLQGEAKRAYMREYMRRRRAGLPTRKPRPKPRPERAKRAKAEPAKPVPKCCSFCGKPRTVKRILVGPDGTFPLICARCTTRAATIFAKQHRPPRRRKRGGRR